MTIARSPRSERDRGGQDRLVEAAETLFGRHGIDGVSMRQIQLAAGSSNNFAVQYHFGGLAGIVEAILTRRIPVVEARQATLLAAIERGGRTHDVRALLAAFVGPLLDQVDAAGERSYARFISALLRSPGGEHHCRALLHMTPTAVRILDLLRHAVPGLPPGMLEERLRLLSGMVCTSVFNRLSAVQGPVADARLIDDALDVAAAGLAVSHRAAGPATTLSI